MPHGKDGKVKEYVKLALFAFLAVVIGYITVFYLRGDLPLPFLPTQTLDSSAATKPLQKPSDGPDNPTSLPVNGNDAEHALHTTFEKLTQLFPAISGEVSGELYDASRHKFTFISSLPQLNDSYLAVLDEEFETEEEVDAPQLYARMGFLFRNNEDGTQSLFDANGRLIFEKIPEDMTLLSARDSLDRPIFKQGKKYLYFDANTQSFLPSDYDPEKDGRGLDIDHPEYFGKTDTDVLVYIYTDTTVGCALAEKPNTLLVSGYADAFAPKEGFAVFVNKNGKLSIRGVDALTRPLFSGYSLYLPESLGEESMGYFYFDHGLMRARLKIMSGKKVVSDEEIILKSDGSVFSIPPDYKVVSYSDGVFLLEKDGLYGYYSHEGKWICAPVYSYARPFFEGVAVCGYQGGEKCVIDTAGNCIVPFYYQEIGDCSGGLITVYSSQNGWNVLQKVL